MMFYCLTLSKNSVAKTRALRTFTIFYLTLLVYLQLWLWIKRRKIKKDDGTLLFKISSFWVHRALLLMRLCTIYWNLANYQYRGTFIVDTYRFQLLYMQNFLVRLIFKKMKSLPWFEEENWCVDQIYYDKLARNDRDVKLSLDQ